MEYNPFSLRNKTILITGASSGIGRTTAIECSRLGATLFLTGRNEDRLKETFSCLEGEGHQLFVADLKEEEDIDRLVDSLPIINGCVNNAGVASPLPTQFISKTSLEDVFQSNTFSGILLTQKMVKKKKLTKPSSVVFTSSISGTLVCYPGGSSYGASKGAIHGFIKGAAIDLASKGIRLNSVNPGMINTEILKDGAVTDEQIRADIQKYPLKRYGKAEEVAWAIIYLLSDASSWTTGANITVDGGYTLQ